MKVLAIMSPESPQAVGHLEALAAAGWDVHAVPTGSDRFPRELDDRIVVHYSPLTRRAWPLWPARSAMKLPSRVRTPVRVGAAPPGAAVRSAPGLVGPKAVLALAATPPGSDVDSFVTWLAATIDRLQPDVVHSNPVRAGGAYAYAARVYCHRAFPPWLVSNWGSDLRFVCTDAAKLAAAEAILAAATGYLAESERDAADARSRGLRGAVLGVMPGSAGADPVASHAAEETEAPSHRRTVVVNGQQGLVGRGLVALEAIRRCSDDLRGFDIEVYGSAEEIRMLAEILAAECGLRVTTQSPTGGRRQMLHALARARAVVSLSVHGAMDMWALEAMTVGAFPIQSSKAFVDGWTEDGRTTLLVHPDEPTEAATALSRALRDDGLVDGAAALNMATARRRYSRDTLLPQLTAIYERAVAGP